MQKIATYLAIFLAALITTAANATVIDTGEIFVKTPNTGGGNFTFSIFDIPVTGHYDEGTRFRHTGYYEGESFSGNQQLSGGVIDFFDGYVGSQFVIWHQTVSPIGSHLNTNAPGAQLVQGQTVYYSDFDFSGTLCGTVHYNPPACDVVFNLTGKGVAEFSFDESVLEDGRHLFVANSVRYTFVPEPGTLALLGLGLVAIAFTKRRNYFASTALQKDIVVSAAGA